MTRTTALFKVGCQKHRTIVPVGHAAPCWLCEREKLTGELATVEGQRNGLALERDLARSELAEAQAEVERLLEMETRAWYVYKDGIDDAAFHDEWPDSLTEYVSGQLAFVLACDPDAETPAGYVKRGELEAAKIGEVEAMAVVLGLEGTVGRLAGELEVARVALAQRCDTCPVHPSIVAVDEIRQADSQLAALAESEKDNG